MDIIDCFASDHAPHTIAEKDGTNPPPGFPGLETMLPMFMNAVSDGRLKIDDLILRCVENPRKIFDLPEQRDTWLEIDETAEYTIKAKNLHSRCGWTPFENFRVKGLLKKVILRGKTVYEDGEISIEPGYGRNVRE